MHLLCFIWGTEQKSVLSKLNLLFWVYFIFTIFTLYRSHFSPIFILILKCFLLFPNCLLICPRSLVLSILYFILIHQLWQCSHIVSLKSVKVLSWKLIAIESVPSINIRYLVCNYRLNSLFLPVWIVCLFNCEILAACNWITLLGFLLFLVLFQADFTIQYLIYWLVLSIVTFYVLFNLLKFLFNVPFKVEILKLKI